MSQTCGLNTFVCASEEVITYLEDPTKVTGHLDLGSADLWTVRDQNDRAFIIILTSSGASALIPADFVVSLR
jgi:hypothetical protein